MPKRAESSLDREALTRLLREQEGVVSRQQLGELGASRADVRRLLARRELQVVHPGVYVDHSGPTTRRQQQWAAVLACAPAALHRESALDAHGMTRDRSDGGSRGRTIHLVVDRHRRISPPDGVTVERVAEHDQWVQANRRPPRAVLDFALLKAASDRDPADAIALLSDAVHQGLTTADRLAAMIERLPRLRQRALLGEILADVASGTRSVLEQRYLSATSNGPTGCPRANGRCGRARPAASSTATYGTVRSVSWSSSTGRSATGTASTGGPTSSATSTRRSTTTSPSDRGGPRSSSRAASHGWSVRCCSAVVGSGEHATAVRGTRSPTMEVRARPRGPSLHRRRARNPRDACRGTRLGSAA